jgi:hypothetical protein
MSYEKYLKYKTKYLNLKAMIHNQKINQSGGGDLESLGSEPLSSIQNIQTGGADLESLGSEPLSSIENIQTGGADLESLGSEPLSSIQTGGGDLESLGTEPLSSIENVQTGVAELEIGSKPLITENNLESFKQNGGKKLTRKEKHKVFSDSESDSDYCTTESSMLSFSTDSSSCSDDTY